MRNTTQRNLILDITNNSCEHLTAEEVYEIARKSISNISLGTVYRNLNILVELQKIRKIKMWLSAKRKAHRERRLHRRLLP